MIRLIEEGAALEQVQDLLHSRGDVSGIPSPEDIAPPPDRSSEYIEDEDPEMLKGSLNERMIQSLTNRLIEAGVNKTAAITAFLNSGSPDKSYEKFMESEWGSSEINQSTYRGYTKSLQSTGRVNLSDEQLNQAIRLPGRSASSGSGGKGIEMNERPALPSDYKPSDNLSRLSQSYAEQVDFKGGGSAAEQFEQMIAIIADVASGESSQRHALIAGSPGCGKTYSCVRALEANIGRNKNGAQSLYFKGNIGKSLTSLVGFFYHYRNNYVIMLDDNDAMIMKQGCPQQIKLFFKAILDPDALDQPIAIPTTVLKGVANARDALRKGDEERAKKASAKKEGTLIQIDRDRLREGQLLVTVNGREALDQIVPLHEALELHASLRESDEWDDDAIDPDENPDMDDLKSFQDEDDDMPTEFFFNSSVIFISNLSKDEIDPAVWDRFITFVLQLTPLEFMERLSGIYDRLGTVNPTITSTPQKMVDWAKKVVLVLMQGVVEAWQAGVPLMGVNIEIPKNALTFRLFLGFVEYFLRTARIQMKKTPGSLDNKAYRDQITLTIERAVLKEILKKICFPGS